MGPRALGNRSIVAEPFERLTSQRLNEIKKREHYRPIAPICLESEAERLFGATLPSPHMLYFHSVRSDRLKAITHVDGSARVQTVNHEQNMRMFDLLAAFKKQTGYGVLCNTSLNFCGKGFINRSSDLYAYVIENAIDGFVIDDSAFFRA